MPKFSIVNTKDNSLHSLIIQDIGPVPGALTYTVEGWPGDTPTTYNSGEIVSYYDPETRIWRVPAPDYEGLGYGYGPAAGVNF